MSFEDEFDSFYENDLNNLYLQFWIDVGDNDIGESDNVKCLVCMNVDDDSEHQDGDIGFAACYKR